ncbi:unnamed protein product, partial [Medioppia subpectinata]
METNRHSNSDHKSKTLVYLLIVFILTIVLLYLTRGEDFVTFFLIFATLMIISFMVLFCVKCCCRRRLTSGAILSPHLVVTQVVPNSGHNGHNRHNRHHSMQTNNHVVIAQTRPQMVSQMRQNTTPLMSSPPTMNGTDVLESTAFTPCIPSAPPLDVQHLSHNQTLPTYEEAIQSNLLHLAVVADIDTQTMTNICQFVVKNFGLVGINSRNNLLQTPLHIASCIGNQNLVKLLMDFGADISAVDRNIENAIHLAVKYGNSNCLEALVSKCSDNNALNALNINGLSPLH